MTNYGTQSEAALGVSMQRGSFMQTLVPTTFRLMRQMAYTFWISIAGE
jgi:hypothetical protein